MPVSIITVSYNNKSGLEKTIESVFSQEAPPHEYLIIDGGSTDGSLELIRSYSDRLTWWVSEKDNGIYDAMNKGVKQAKGNYLMFLNSGDTLCEPDVLKKCLVLIEQKPGDDIYYGDIYIVNDVHHPAPFIWHHPENLSLSFFKKETINHQAAFIKATLFEEIGFYPEHLPLAADYWFWLKNLLANKTFRHLLFPLVNYDLGGTSSVNRTFYRQEMKEVWEHVVPSCVQDLVAENETYKKTTDYKLVRMAIQFNKKYQRLKKR